MPNFLQRLHNGYRVRKIEEWYYSTFYPYPREYTIKHNEITGPYRIVMRLADGPGMRRRLREGYEVAQRRAFLPLLGPSWVCCDVGAHVGDYTIEMALRVGPEGKVFAYEAVPHYFDLLQRTVQANGLINVVTKLAIVGAKAGTATVPSEMLTGNIARPGKIAKLPSGDTRKVAMAKVPVVRLDDELDRLDAIKVDCEGYEVEVLKGMEKLVGKNPALILFLEVHERQLGEVGSSLSQLARVLLQEYRFKVHQIGFKHCVCSRSDLPLAKFPQVTTSEEFVKNFRGT